MWKRAVDRKILQKVKLDQTSKSRKIYEHDRVS